MNVIWRCAAGLLLVGCQAELSGPSSGANGGSPPGSAVDSDPRPDPDPTPNPDVDPDVDPDPGVEPCVGAPAPLTRLNRDEIERAVEAALGVPAPGARALPPDETAGSFAVNHTAPPSEPWVRTVMELAESVATQLPEAVVRCTADDCLDAALEAVARPLMRRAITADERSALRDLWNAGRDISGDASDGWRAVVEGLLQSPDFLYRPAPDPERPERLAARLAFVMWGEGPDDVLVRAAREGRLASRDGLAAEIDRMLADPRARWLSERFTIGWLDLSRLSEVTKNYSLLRFDREVRAAMEEETIRFVDAVVRNGQGNLHTLMTARWTYLTEPLLPIYGVAVPDGFDPERPMTLPDGQRYGVLSHPSVLTTHSTSRYSSPVARGSMILDHMVCRPIPLPDIDIPELPEPVPGQTARERLAQHTDNPACASCHDFIDPMGFSLEAFDAIGQYRTETEYGAPVDDEGALAIGDPADGPAVGVRELSNRLLESDAFRSCFVQQWMKLVLSRPLTADDRCVQDPLEAKFAASGYDVRTLITETVLSPAFRGVAEEND